MKIPNNQEKIADKISKEFGVEAIADDGSVIIKNVSEEIAAKILVKFGDIEIGDGIQQGSLWMNGEEF